MLSIDSILSLSRNVENYENGIKEIILNKINQMFEFQCVFMLLVFSTCFTTVLFYS